MRRVRVLLAVLGVLAPGEGRGQPPVELVIAATTDVHGRLRGWDYFAGREDRDRGLARAATVIDSVRAANPERVVLVDAGDLLQGNPLTYVAARIRPFPVHPVMAAMNAMRYDAAVIGNHEFNYGVPLLDSALARSTVPFLGANIYRADRRTRAYPPFTLVRRGGITVGIIGLTTPGAMVWDRDFLTGRLWIADIVPEAQRAVDEARAAGADVVIAVMHSGLGEPTSYDTTRGLGAENAAARVAMETRGLDLIVYGHSHREMADTVIGRTTLIQPRNFAANVAVATLRVERDSAGRWAVTRKRGRLVTAAGQPEQAAVVAATADAHAATMAYVSTPIGTTASVWRADSARVVDTPLTDFVLEVMRRKAGADLAAGAAFDLSARLDSGPITVAQLARLYPYDNTLRAVRISGAQLRAFLEQSARYFGQVDDAGRMLAGQVPLDPKIPGFNFDLVAGADYVIDLRRPVGARITELTVRGRPVTATDTFTMALSNYRQTGGGGFAMLEGAPVTYSSEGEVRQFLEDEVRRVGTLAPANYAQRNWRIEPSGAVATMYAAMNPGSRRAEASPRPAAWPATVRYLRVLAINDFHGQLEPWTAGQGEPLGGGVALAAAIERARTECRPQCTTVLVDAGDRFTGPLSSNRNHGRAVVQFMNALDLSASALGNHEFDWGVDTMRARIRDTRAAVLGANVRGPDGQRPRWLRADTLIERDGLKIGIIGVAATHTSRTTHWRHVRGYRFLDPVPDIESQARALRARGATHVIVVAHESGGCDRDEPTRCSGPALDIARQSREPLDAVIAGHNHWTLDARVGRTPVVQAWSSGRALAIVDLPIGNDLAPRSEVRRLTARDTAGAPANAARIVQTAVAAAAAEANRVVATLAEDLPENPRHHALGRLLADAQRSIGRADIALVNDGGVRAPLKAGPVTFGQLYAVQPYGNALTRLTLRGRDVTALMERAVTARGADWHVSGVRIEWDSLVTDGPRVTRVTLGDGRAIRPQALYTVIVNDFMLGDDVPAATQRAAVSIVPLRVTDVAALERYLAAQPQPVQPVREARIIERHQVATGGGGR
ncbi:MAG: 5'-nucleotidase C-terminal domain-containing protein [Gemmatimonadaceae bacterium]|jgi:2',3'-cyclic-nucleotide 2'-phosphodiesterase/3'-nucleotidase/5'-nucleotidase|nr:5'-nucleotidase C-terminal domain-containing protein [Gemmatimonadaceae bacterium]